METVTLYRLFTTYMAAFVNGRRLDAPRLTPEEWGRLYALARRQSLSGALYTALRDSDDIPDAVRVRLRRDAYRTLSKYETQTQACKEIAAALDAAAIPHVFFKGAVVRRYYPDPAMRSMGDIDAAVHDTDRLRADEALRAAGFALVSQGAEVWTYSRAEALLELHTVLRRYDVREQHPAVYGDVWADARQKRDHTYALSDEAEIVFVIAHMGGHFCAGGCGLRQLMDVAVLYRRFPDEALWQTVLSKLDESGLRDFARHMLWLCGAWLDVTVPPSLTQPLDDGIQTAFLERLLSDGTFGADERVMLSRMRKERRLHKSGGKFGTAVRWLFPPPQEMERSYPYVGKTPLLLPLAYAQRVFSGVKNRRIHQTRLRYAAEQQDSLENELTLFEQLGL